MADEIPEDVYKRIKNEAKGKVPPKSKELQQFIDKNRPKDGNGKVKGQP